MPRRSGREGLLLAGLLLAVLLLLPSAPTAAGTATPAAPHGSPWARPLPASAHAPVRGSALPLLGWGEAYIIYGPGDDTTHVFGEGAGMVAYNPGWNITLFGGEGSGGLTNATSNYNSTTGAFTWQFYTPSPSARANFSFASVPSRGFAVLFGGLTNLSSQRTDNQTWLYWFGNQSWQQVSGARAPPARESAAFAVNDSGRTALLEGGWSPRTAVGNSSATVFWNDTWQLNLTTLRWSELSPPSAPPAMAGSGMIWDAYAQRFDLFGGCAVLCSNTLWSFAGHPGDWHRVSTTGASPSPRASSAYAWDGIDSIALLFGGFAWSGSAATAYGDTFAFDPVAAHWTALNLANNPGARFDAPSTWAEYPGCTGLNIVGGSPSLLAPPTNASVLESITAPTNNCFPDLYTGLGGPPPPSCSVNGTAVDLEVRNRLTGAGVPNASVQVSGHCLDRRVLTNSAGFANFSAPSPDTVNFTSAPPGYHPGNLTALIAPNITNRPTLELSPLPALRARTYGIDLSGVPAPLYNVSVYAGTSVLLGRSNAEGYLNVSDLASPTGSLLLHGLLVNHSASQANISVPYTGYAYANLSLQDPGPFTLDVIDAATGRGIAAATGIILPLDPGNLHALPYTTAANGSFFDATLAGGNYSVGASAAGYVSGGTSAPVFHPWRNRTVLVLSLTARYGANLSVRLLDASTGQPIAGGSVVVGANPPATTNAAGWANFTDLLPPGATPVTGTASGYLGNRTYVTLAYYAVFSEFDLRLTPASHCARVGCPPPAASGTAPGPFAFLPAGSVASTALLVGAPAAILALALAYLLIGPARRRSGGSVERGAR
ncbi:MAG: hypothetical protein L3K13_01995 [Thermoplasmata archaeon]|nr:hypothetical protein [Thermoplasmata archaeon]